MKKVVQFKASQVCFIHHSGAFALVFPIDHPDSENVSNRKHVRTSQLINPVVWDDEGNVIEFETLNTKYVINKEK